ncbi:MAG: polysaccharide deacetylase family protein, partial [Kiritimatiellae bacterium]|nr:polysaccharide deacetylase family protein [Kiritimatiellia bacterium]
MKKRSLVILRYRNISPVCGVSPEEFRCHLEWLRKNGWGTIGIDEAVGILKGGGEAPEKTAVVTFDDCYLDNWVHAAPILRATGMKGSFGVATAYVHGGGCRPDAGTAGADLRGLPVAREAWEMALARDDTSGFMSAVELGELAAAGHDLFSHTHTHQACF